MYTRLITRQTLSQQVGRARTGVRTNVVSRIDRRVIDDRVVSTATIPFIRPRYVAFLGRSFKPNTRLYAFFDEIDVTKYITPASNVTVTMNSGTFDYNSSAEFYGEETELQARKVSGNHQSAFNKGDIVFVVNRSSTTYTISNTPATGVLGYVGNGNVLYLHNIKGSFNSGDIVNGTISTACATLSAAVTAKNMGDNLITNENGDVIGTFFIPNTQSLRFRTGTRELILTDSSTNDKIIANTQGRVSYTASGTLQTRQATIASTRNAEVVRETVTETDTITNSTENITNDSGWYDPLAQTFLVDVKNGCFLTKVDIFFSTKDSNLPVTLEIRNTVNGYPGRKLLPFARVTKRAEDVVTSNNASVATTFTFESPVYVEENSEYCIVLLSDSVNYNVWISQLGEDMIGTDRRISQQPYAGVFFKSQNASTWTADQLQDLKFKLYRAKFDISTVGNFAYVNESLPTERLPRNAIRLFKDKSTVRITHPNHGMDEGSNVVISGLGTQGEIYNIPSSNINKQHFPISNVLLDSYTITTTNVATGSATLVTSNLRATHDIIFNVINPIVQFRNFSGTSVNFLANTSPATFYGTRSSSPVSVLVNNNNYFEEPQAIKATVNETASSGTIRKSFELTAKMSSTVDNLSPVIDLNRSSLIAISNRITNIKYVGANAELTAIVTGNTKIRFSGTQISTNHPTIANVLSQLVPGKSIMITNVGGNATNNANVLISSVVNKDGIANVETYYTFISENPGNAITIVQREGYVDERAPVGGLNVAKYVTRQINLKNPSRFLKILFSANTPKQGEIDVYYRTLPVGSLTPLSEQNYVLISPVENLVKTDNPSLYSDVNYEIDDIPSFTAVAIKIVFRSTNSSKVPSIKDLRIIACP